MWNTGDILNKLNLNRKTAEIAGNSLGSSVGTQSPTGGRQYIRVSNETGQEVLKGNVFEVKDGYIDDQFIQGKGTLIDADTVDAFVMIALEDIPDDGAGFAAMFGLHTCIVDVTDVDHKYCNYEVGEVKLKSQEERSRFRIIKADLGDPASPDPDTVCLIMANAQPAAPTLYQCTVGYDPEGVGTTVTGQAVNKDLTLSGTDVILDAVVDMAVIFEGDYMILGTSAEGDDIFIPIMGGRYAPTITIGAGNTWAPNDDDTVDVDLATRRINDTTYKFRTFTWDAGGRLIGISAEFDPP